MGWDKGRYYTRSKKIGGRVVREYVGGGLLGQLAAELDAEERSRRKAEAEALRGELAHYAEAEETLAALCDLTDTLVRAALLLAGYHQHNRGEWRRKRGQSETEGAD